MAFKARRNTNQNTTAGGSINLVCNGVYYSYGGGYDPATGYFTAPVSGIYRFIASAYTEQGSAMGRGFFSSQGTATSGIKPDGGAVSRLGERGDDVDASNVRRVKGEYEIYMAAGETFGLNLYTSTVQNINHQDTYLAGRLVARA